MIHSKTWIDDPFVLICKYIIYIFFALLPHFCGKLRRLSARPRCLIGWSASEPNGTLGTESRSETTAVSPGKASAKMPRAMSLRCSRPRSAEWKINENPNWVCLKMVSTPKPNGFHDHYPVFKWLFYWEYSLFSDKPISSIGNYKWWGSSDRFRYTVKPLLAWIRDGWTFPPYSQMCSRQFTLVCACQANASAAGDAAVETYNVRRLRCRQTTEVG